MMERSISEKDIISWAEENMTYWKIPKYVEIIQEVPKNIYGKVQRRILQEADPLYKK